MNIGDIKSSKKAYEYAKTIGKPVPELEDVIAEDLYYSYCYAKNIIKGRFRKGEDAIAQSPIYSYYYAVNIIKGRFEKGEDIIMNSDFASDYVEEFGIK